MDLNEEYRTGIKVLKGEDLEKMPYKNLEDRKPHAVLVRTEVELTEDDLAVLYGRYGKSSYRYRHFQDTCKAYLESTIVDFAVAIVDSVEHNKRKIVMCANQDLLLSVLRWHIAGDKFNVCCHKIEFAYLDRDHEWHFTKANKYGTIDPDWPGLAWRIIKLGSDILQAAVRKRKYEEGR